MAPRLFTLRCHHLEIGVWRAAVRSTTSVAPQEVREPAAASLQRRVHRWLVYRVCRGYLEERTTVAAVPRASAVDAPVPVPLHSPLAPVRPATMVSMVPRAACPINMFRPGTARLVARRVQRVSNRQPVPPVACVRQDTPRTRAWRVRSGTGRLQQATLAGRLSPCPSQSPPWPPPPQCAQLHLSTWVPRP